MLTQSNYAEDVSYLVKEAKNEFFIAMRERTIMIMTSNKVIKIVITSILITSINSTNTYAAGRNNSLPANTVLSGKGVPSTKIGINGDFYIDTRSLNFYGPKTKDKWPLPISLKGPAGPIGPSGVDGKNGVAGTSTSSTGAVGPTGATGATGSVGSTGATGPAGATGAGITGAVGPAGPMGETGTVGSTGAVGPTNVYVGSIPFVGTLAAEANNSKNSGSFGSFTDGKKYLVDIMIAGANNDSGKYALSLNVTATAGSPTITVKYLVIEGQSYRGGLLIPEHSLVAKVVIDGTAAGADFSLIASVTSGTRTTTAPITFSGDYFAIVVGAIN